MDTSVLLSPTTAVSFAVLACTGFVATSAANTYLSKARWQERWTFIWLAFDALIHFVAEGSLVFLSTSGRQVRTSSGLFAELWKEYATADHRWSQADPGIVATAMLGTILAGSLCVYIITLFVKNDPARHYWLIVLSIAELHATYSYNAPEWVAGYHNLNTSNPLHLLVYVGLLNSPWVVIPLCIMYESYTQIVEGLRAANWHRSKALVEKAELLQ